MTSDRFDVLVVDQQLSAEAVERALGDRFDVAREPIGIDDLPAVLDAREPDALLLGPSTIAAAPRISALTGGSLVLLGPAQSEALQKGGDEPPAEAVDLLKLAVQLACISPLLSWPL